MTIRQLKELIEDLNDDVVVIMSKDGEGNAFSPLFDIDNSCIYVAESTWSGEIYPKVVNGDSSDEDCYDGSDGHDCVVLWPTN